MTQRLWLSEPRRATALATVTVVRGPWFQLDRSLFAPRSRAYRHPAPADSGNVWLGGDKRVLQSVQERDGQLWHRLEAGVPVEGQPVRLELDARRRATAERAHTALHLVLAALPGLEMDADPEVRGGGRFRIHPVAAPAPAMLAAALQKANAWVDADRPVRVAAVARGPEAVLTRQGLTPQRFRPPDPFPGPRDVAWTADVEGVCGYPCDGRHVGRTHEVGRIRFEAVRPGFILGATG